MAGLIGENYHEFQPSPFTTALVPALTNPKTQNAALPFFNAAQAADATNQAGYQQVMDQIRRQQVQQVQQENAMKAIGEVSKLAAIPGGSDIVKNSLLGAYVPAAAMARSDQAAGDKAQADAIGNIGRGLGAANIQAPELVSRVTGGGTQGEQPLIAAARVNAEGRANAARIGAAGKGGDTVQQMYDQAGNKIGPETRTTKNAPRVGAAAPVAPGGQSLQNIIPQAGGLKPAKLDKTSDSGVVPQAIIAANSAAPEEPTAPAASGALPPAEIQSQAGRLIASVSTLKSLHPDWYQDIQAGIDSGGNPRLSVDPVANKVVLVGASGRKYAW